MVPEHADRNLTVKQLACSEKVSQVPIWTLAVYNGSCTSVLVGSLISCALHAYTHSHAHMYNFFSFTVPMIAACLR